MKKCKTRNGILLYYDVTALISALGQHEGGEGEHGERYEKGAAHFGAVLLRLGLFPVGK